MLKRREETRSNLHPDRIDEQNQPEFPEKMKDILIHRESEMSQNNSDKQNKRDSERYTENLYFPQLYPCRNNQWKQQYGMPHTFSK